MSRYVDVEPLDVVGTKGVSKDYADGMAYVLDLLDNLSIADVVEVSKILKTADEQEKQGFIQTAMILRKLVEE